jgi:chromosome segregation ATPase
MKKALLVLAIAFTVTGCAAGRTNYQSDVDALSNKVNGLQTQLDAKNREISALQDQQRAYAGQVDAAQRQSAGIQDQQRALAAQLDAANRAKADAEARLAQAMDKLSASSSSSSGTVKKSSYIK